MELWLSKNCYTGPFLFELPDSPLSVEDSRRPPLATLPYRICLKRMKEGNSVRHQTPDGRRVEENCLFRSFWGNNPRVTDPL